MEKRKLNISFNKSGRGSISPRINLPTTWVKEMGITQDEKEVNVYFVNGEIIITKKEIEKIEGADKFELMIKEKFLMEISQDARVEYIVYTRGYYKLLLKEKYASTYKNGEPTSIFYVTKQKEVREIMDKIVERA